MHLFLLVYFFRSIFYFKKYVHHICTDGSGKCIYLIEINLNLYLNDTYFKGEVSPNDNEDWVRRKQF